MGRTKKVGTAGKYGPRYGVKVRRRLNEIESERVKRRPCPQCQHVAVQRTSSSIWECSHCRYKYAAGAYIPKIRGFRREEAVVEEGAEGPASEGKEAKQTKAEKRAAKAKGAEK